MTNDNQIHQIQVAEVEGSFLLYNVYRLTMIFDSNSGSTLNQSLNLFVTCLHGRGLDRKTPAAQCRPLGPRSQPENRYALLRRMSELGS